MQCNEHEGRRKKDDDGDEEEKEEDEIDANTFWPSQRRPCQAGGKPWFCFTGS